MALTRIRRLHPINKSKRLFRLWYLLLSAQQLLHWCRLRFKATRVARGLLKSNSHDLCKIWTTSSKIVTAAAIWIPKPQEKWLSPTSIDVSWAKTLSVETVAIKASMICRRAILTTIRIIIRRIVIMFCFLETVQAHREATYSSRVAARAHFNRPHIAVGHWSHQTNRLKSNHLLK